MLRRDFFKSLAASLVALFLPRESELDRQMAVYKRGYQRYLDALPKPGDPYEFLPRQAVVRVVSEATGPGLYYPAVIQSFSDVDPKTVRRCWLVTCSECPLTVGHAYVGIKQPGADNVYLAYRWSPIKVI